MHLAHVHTSITQHHRLTDSLSTSQAISLPTLRLSTNTRAVSLTLRVSTFSTLVNPRRALSSGPLSRSALDLPRIRTRTRSLPPRSQPRSLATGALHTPRSLSPVSSLSPQAPLRPIPRVQGFLSSRALSVLSLHLYPSECGPSLRALRCRSGLEALLLFLLQATLKYP